MPQQAPGCVLKYFGCRLRGPCVSQCIEAARTRAVAAWNRIRGAQKPMSLSASQGSRGANTREKNLSRRPTGFAGCGIAGNIGAARSKLDRSSSKVQPGRVGGRLAVEGCSRMGSASAGDFRQPDRSKAPYFEETITSHRRGIANREAANRACALTRRGPGLKTRPSEHGISL